MSTQAAAEHSILRSSAIMAAGTVVSRVTGFLRTAVLAFALGTTALADAYNTANNIPNIVYELLLGGILTSVVVPLIVRARRRDADGGQAYEQRFLTLVTIALFVCTVAAVAAAGPIISVYARSFTPDQREVAVSLAHFFIPQIFFYGVGALAGAFLQSRGRFAAPMWTPVLNNLVVIAVGATFLAVTHGGVSPATITPGEIRLLGIGTTAGIVVQTLTLVPSLRAVGFRLRLRADFLRIGLSEVARIGAWILAYVLTNQLGLLVVTRLATSAGVQARHAELGYGAGYTPYVYAFLLFSLPHAIVAVSIITALLPRMSGHADEGRLDLVRDDFSSGLRLAAVLIVPAAVGFLALGPQIAVVLFAHLRTTVPDAVFIGYVLSAFGCGLVFFSTFQLMLRVFYALRDTRTPALINVCSTAVNIALDVVFFLTLPTGWIVVGLGFAYGMSYIVGAGLSGLVLRRRLGRLDGRHIAATLGKLAAAVVPGGVFAYAMGLAFTQTFGTETITSALAIVVGVAGGGLLYVLIARRLGVAELDTVTRMLTRKVAAR
ncbi:MAG: murein biosynthesis integral membrane protein MurJ [Streptosporangiaceae bacterium]